MPVLLVELALSVTREGTNNRMDYVVQGAPIESLSMIVCASYWTLGTSLSTIPGRKTLPMWMAPFIVDAIDSDGHRYTLHYKYDERITIKRGAQDVKHNYEDDDDPDVMSYARSRCVDRLSWTD
jgi:hypothetical protein